MTQEATLPEEITLIIDTSTGELVVEGMSAHEAAGLLPEFAAGATPINCGRPAERTALPEPDETQAAAALGFAQVFSVYHHVVTDGPGVRTTIQLSGCSVRCPGCYLPETHDPHAGKRLPITQVVELALAPEGEPRDGVTVLGGEPFDQPRALATIARELKRRGQHLTVYTGHTLEQLRERADPDVDEVLSTTDLLIDGPFVRELAQGAGEWRGSTNQRIIPLTRL